MNLECGVAAIIFRGDCFSSPPKDSYLRHGDSRAPPCCVRAMNIKLSLPDLSWRKPIPRLTAPHHSWVINLQYISKGLSLSLSLAHSSCLRGLKKGTIFDKTCFRAPRAYFLFYSCVRKLTCYANMASMDYSIRYANRILSRCYPLRISCRRMKEDWTQPDNFRNMLIIGYLDLIKFRYLNPSWWAMPSVIEEMNDELGLFWVERVCL